MNGRAYERTLKRAHPRTNEGNERKNNNLIQNVLEEFLVLNFSNLFKFSDEMKKKQKRLI